MNNLKIIPILFIVLFFIKCKQTESPFPSANYMTLDSIQYVNKFPLSMTINNEDPVDLEIIGMKNFIIYDSLLISYTSDKDGFWSFYSINNYTYLGKYLKKGDGPNEFTQITNVTEASFYKKQNELYAGIYDFNRGNAYEININKSLKNKTEDLYIISDSLPAILFNFAIIDSTSFFCKKITDNQTQQIRFMLNNKKEYIPNNLKNLNQACIRPREDINILSTITKINRNKDLIVEIPIGLNQINLYSIDDSFGKTICVGKELDNIENIQNKNKWNRTYTYGNLRIYDNYFAALYINENEKLYQIKRTTLPILHFFDWNGNPILELKLNNFITGFDIDFTNGYLYTFDQKSDQFCKYNIKNILDKINTIID